MKWAMFLILFAAAPAFAQTATSGSVSGSNASSHSQQANAQQLAATNALTINQAPIPTNEAVHYSGVDRSAPGTFLGAFAGSASPDACSSTSQVGVSGPGFSAAAGKGHVEPGCEHRRQAEIFGKLADDAAAHGNSEASGKAYQAAVWEACTADDKTTTMCRSLGLVQ